MESKSSNYPVRYDFDTPDFNILTDFSRTRMKFNKVWGGQCFNNLKKKEDFQEIFDRQTFSQEYFPEECLDNEENFENVGEFTGRVYNDETISYPVPCYSSYYNYAPFFPTYEEQNSQEFQIKTEENQMKTSFDNSKDIYFGGDTQIDHFIPRKQNFSSFQEKSLELKVSAAEFNPEPENHSNQEIKSNNQNEDFELKTGKKQKNLGFQNDFEFSKSSFLENYSETLENDEKFHFSCFFIEEIENFFENKKQQALESAQKKIKQIEEETQNELEILNKEKEDLISKLTKNSKTSQKSSSMTKNMEKSSIFSTSSNQDSLISSEILKKNQQNLINSSKSLENNGKNIFFLLNSTEKSTFYSKNMQNTIKLVIPDWVPGLSILAVDWSTVLINPGYSSDVKKFDIFTKQKQSLPSLPVCRKFAGFTFINNCPALVGGVLASESFSTDTVEILNENEWKAGPSLNKPRSSPECLVFQGKTFVFGGLPLEVNDLIEVFDGDKWTIIQPRLPEKILKFGVTSYKEEIFIVGGKFIGENDKRRLGIWHFNPETSTSLTKVENLEVSFISNNPASSVVIQGKLFFLDSEREKVMEIPLEMNS
jgi:hypothetical protein